MGRLKEIRDAASITQGKLAELLGVTSSFISQAERGDKELSREVLIKLREALGVSIDWFLTGEGEMLLSRKSETTADLSDDQVASDQMHNCCAFGQEDQMFHGGTFEEEGQIPHGAEFAIGEEQEETVPSTGARGPSLSLMGALVPEAPRRPGSGVPVSEGQPAPGPSIGSRMEGGRAVPLAIVGDDDDEAVKIAFFSSMTAGAGPGREVEEYQESTPLKIMRRFLLPWRPEQVRALEVRGDSMTKVGLFDRDIVLFVPEEKEGDGVFVISIENRMQVKRLEFDILGKTLRIISENDRYQPRVLTEQAEIERVIIEGKVVGWLHKHPY